ncbi:transposable element Tc1 transposase [Trichonephila clavipes]|uniref:Transposable element Tc1 transposase n=1 Tax=Trichonephila clavipes TaxID=2585209 RepID=A0A8X6VJB2_TRICX|nr:transposable element Tc1 transposase [Trichonephila clavipes]
MVRHHKDISVGVRNLVISHWKEGKSVRCIGKILELSKSAVLLTSLTDSRKQIVLKTSKDQGVQGYLMNVKKSGLKRNAELVSTVKHGGGGIRVQGCMEASEVGSNVVINGIMDHLYNLQILKGILSASAEKLGIEDYQFYQDNDLKYSTLNPMLWLLYNCPKVIKIINQSPDLNPIEEKRLRERHFLINVKWRSLVSAIR